MIRLFSSSQERLGPSAAAIGLFLIAAFLPACSYSPVVRVLPHRIEHPRSLFLNSQQFDEALARTLFPEVIDYVTMQPIERREEPRMLDALGRALSAERRYPEARTALARARDHYGKNSTRGSVVAWLESQAAFQEGNTAEALQALEQAHESSFPVPPGWLAFLRILANQTGRLNVITGDRARLFFRYGHPRLPRIDVAVDGKKIEAIVDTGAALTLISEAAAARMKIVPIAGTDAEGSGIHGARFPVRFGLIRELEIGGLKVSQVPVGIIPDSALEFEDKAGTSRYEFLLGCHLWKEFRVEIDYPGRTLSLDRPNSLPSSEDTEGANLFVIDGKPIVRGSINGVGWFRFLLDTGSEFTLIHRAGTSRYGSFMTEAPIEPITVHGIGKSRSQWGKISHVTLGVDWYQVFFEDILMTDDRDTPDDAVLGSTFLENFIVTLDFGRLHARIRRPPESEDSPIPGILPPGRNE